MKFRLVGHFLLMLAACLMPLLCFQKLSAEEQKTKVKPNIVIIVADDVGYKDVAYQGAEYPTPNIDWLANNGTIFTNFYTLPVCTQARVALMTGIFPHRMSLHHKVIKENSKKAIPKSIEIIPERLKNIGYKTAIIGKWHLGHHSAEVRPLGRGFDYHFGNYCGFISYYSHLYKGKRDLNRQEKPVVEEGYTTHLFADEAKKYIEASNSEKPFFLYLPFTAAHATLEAPKETIASKSNIKNKKRRLYAAVVTELDLAIGKVIAALKAKGLINNTIIIFASDNGASTRFGGDNGEFREGKGKMYEGGIRVPTIIRAPSYLQTGKKMDKIGRMVDIMPTLYEILGEELSDEIDGRSLLAKSEVTKSKLGDNALLLGFSNQSIAVRQDNFKYILELDTNKEKLFDIISDPSESNDISSRFPEIFAKLRQDAQQLVAGRKWKQEHPDLNIN